MRYRQIHLDFHTSGRIPGIGSAFDAEAFGKAFKEAHVDSVTVFSKCHHGYSYHPTEVGKMHPGLDFDLLRAQIDALHAVGINAPIYTTAQWDELAAIEHPEWRIVSADGSLPHVSRTPGDPGWAYLDFASGYLDYLCAQVDEIMRRYPDGDGIFVDISFQIDSVSEAVKAGMEARGMDWTDPAQREAFRAETVQNFFDRVTDTVRGHDPKMPLFFNTGHIRRGMADHYRRHYSHLELESLPTGGWGYEHFPLSARYAEGIGLPYLGMTGKFHWLWGEVGGYKKSEALIYECGSMIAQGAACSIGDHLHPTAAVDATTMDIIRPAYKWVAEREDWVKGTVNRAEIGVLSVEAMQTPTLGRRPDRSIKADEGVVRVLMEGQYTFDVLDRDRDFTPYRLLILPDEITVDAALAAKIEAYAAQGGNVLLTGQSGLRPEGGFAFDLGAEHVGTSPMTGGDYLLPIPAIRAEAVNDPLFMYLPSEQARLTDGESLGEVFDPYFDRTPRHFSGHVNAPSQPEPTGFVAGSAKGRFTWFAHPVFTCYYTAGAVAMLEIAERLIGFALNKRKMIETTLPRAGRATLRHSPGKKADVLHLLHATPALRGTLGGAPIQPIQDLITLSGIAVTLAATGPIAGVRLVPEGRALEYRIDDGRVAFTVPDLRGHAMVEIAYR